MSLAAFDFAARLGMVGQLKHERTDFPSTGGAGGTGLEERIGSWALGPMCFVVEPNPYKVVPDR